MFDGTQGGGAIEEDHGGFCPATDQRGIHRPQGNACDIGAVERRAFDPFYLSFVSLLRK